RKRSNRGRARGGSSECDRSSDGKAQAKRASPEEPAADRKEPDRTGRTRKQPRAPTTRERHQCFLHAPSGCKPWTRPCLPICCRGACYRLLTSDAPSGPSRTVTTRRYGERRNEDQSREEAARLGRSGSTESGGLECALLCRKLSGVRKVCSESARSGV